MARTEKEWLDANRRGWDETQNLFSREGKPLQEMTAVHGLLRLLGVEHTAGDIAKQGPEPIDVWFQDARFQVTEIIYPPRPRDLEIRQMAERARAAQSIDDLLVPGTIASKPMPPAAVLALVIERTEEKARRYAGQCDSVDLLIYLNFHGHHLYPRGPFTAPPDLEALGWRSVSLIMEQFAIVLMAGTSAPAFLRNRVGEALEWQALESVFDWPE